GQSPDGVTSVRPASAAAAGPSSAGRAAGAGAGGQSPDGVTSVRPASAAAAGPSSAGRAAGAGAGLGAVTGLLGVGGGFLAVPALVTVLAVPMSAAVGTSLLVIVANALVALAARATTAVQLDWALILPFLATAVLGAWDGRRLAAKVSARALQRVFGGVLVAVSAAMGVTALL
ncbi:sulfite exporter TauE/SafE family protein, partial [Streptomyces sp. ms191]|uniref:TSUP family transporter n=1 Tax=Streptomyces sp. ms191 TaxID=1827978 RepID=UPI0011CE77B5